MDDGTGIPRPKQSSAFERTTFETSRLLDFCSEKELTAQSGYERSQWPQMVVKELVDNALDACEEVGVAAVIKIVVDDTGIAISDNGPGIPASTVEGLLNYSSRTSSREAYVSPTRGAQGNALQTILAMPFALDGDHGRVDISAHGQRHEISFRVDQIEQRPAITHAIHRENVKTGTTIKIWWPAKCMETLTAAEYDFLQLADAYTWLNPHLSLTVEWFGETAATLATTTIWDKWRPSDPTPPHWYSPAAFDRLTSAYIAHDRARGLDRSVRELVKEFRGLSGTAKQKAVLEDTGLTRTNLSALVNGHGLKGDLMASLLTAVQNHGKPVKPAMLGMIGETHIRTHMEEFGCAMESFVYRKVATMDQDGLPVVVEVAFAGRSDELARRRLITGVNWSPGIVNPFRTLNYGSLDSLLESQKAGGGEPVVVFVHVARPGIQHKDRGKSSVAISYKMAVVIRDCVLKVTAKWCKIRKAEERQDRKRWQRKELLGRALKSKKASLQEAVFSVLPAAIETASGNGRFKFPERNLFYATRPMTQSITAQELKKSWFKGILTKYEQERGEIPNLYRDPRGYLLEPHTGKTIPLGTREVDDYKMPEFLYNKIMYVEKKGMEPIFRAAKLAEKYDLAIICAEGYAVRAAKALLSAAKEQQGMTLLSMHDADPAGYNIARTLCEATVTCPNHQVDVIDIGLQLQEALEMGLQTEFFYRKNAIPSAIKLSQTEREYFTGEEAAPLNGRRSWKARRIELNALSADPDRFIAWIEGKLQGLGLAKKLLPAPSIIGQVVDHRRDAELLAAATQHILEILDINAIATAVVNKIKLPVRDIPGELKKWAKEVAPEHWKNRVHSLVEGRVMNIDHEIHALAREAVGNLREDSR